MQRIEDGPRCSEAEEKDCKVEADAPIAPFVHEVGGEDEFWQRLAHEANADECSEAEFWRDVVSSVEVNSRLRCIPDQPDKFSRGCRKPSRLQQITGKRT